MGSGQWGKDEGGVGRSRGANGKRGRRKDGGGRMNG